MFDSFSKRAPFLTTLVTGLYFLLSILVMHSEAFQTLTQGGVGGLRYFLTSSFLRCRWNKSPLDDAKMFNRTQVEEYIQSFMAAGGTPPKYLPQAIFAFRSAVSARGSAQKTSRRSSLAVAATGPPPKASVVFSSAMAANESSAKASPVSRSSFETCDEKTGTCAL